MKRTAIAAALAAALAAGAACTDVAAEQDAPAKKAQQRDRIYGYQMMTDAERNEYRQKMRDATTVQERQALRDEHRRTMEARMKERGIEPGQARGKGGGPRGPRAEDGGRGGYGKGGGGPGARPAPGPAPQN